MDRFCKFCGVPHTSDARPQVCLNGHETWTNPVPVAVLLQPVIDDTIPQLPRYGILIGERGIEPMKGTMGLPGGFVNPEDADFIAAAFRELWEETGIFANDEDSTLFSTMSDGVHILVFVESGDTLHLSDLQGRFKPSDECPAIDVAWEPMQLSFQSHTNALAAWFERNA